MHVLIQDFVDWFLREPKLDVEPEHLPIEPWGYSEFLEEALIKGQFPPLLYIIPIKGEMMPDFMNWIFLKTGALNIEDFQYKFAVGMFILIALLKKLMVLINARYTFGWFIQFNPYVFPYSIIMDFTQPFTRLYQGYLPVVAGMDTGLLGILAVLTALVDYLRHIILIMPYGASDLQYDPRLGKAVVDAEPFFGWSLEKYGDYPDDLFVMEMYEDRIVDMGYHVAGLPVIYQKYPEEIPELYKTKLWYGDDCSDELTKYILETYPNIDTRPKVTIFCQKMAWVESGSPLPFDEWAKTDAGIQAFPSLTRVQEIAEEALRRKEMREAAKQVSLNHNDYDLGNAKTLIADISHNIDFEHLPHFKELLINNILHLSIFFH